MRRATLSMLILLMCLILTACGASHEKEDTPADEKEVTVEEDNSYLEHTYEEITIDNLFEVLGENPLKAKEAYLNHFVVFSGYKVSKYLVRDGAFSDHDFLVADYISSENPMVCNFPSDSEEFTEDSKERITVWGEIVAVGSETTFEVNVLHYEFAETPAVENIEYEEVSTTEMIDEYWTDTATGEKKYYQKFISITAPVVKISETEIFIQNAESNDSYSTRGHITCPLTSDEQKHVIATKNKGDMVTITGRVVDMLTVDSMLGKQACFELEIHSIE